MPPSGYSPSQSAFIKRFLASCAEALREEATRFQLTLPSALAREISNIDLITEQGGSDSYALAVLNLTRAFYVSVTAEMVDSGASFDQAVAVALEEVNASIRAVHVPSIEQAYR